jgi:hypothetical protein
MMRMTQRTLPWLAHYHAQVLACAKKPPLNHDLRLAPRSTTTRSSTDAMAKKIALRKVEKKIRKKRGAIDNLGEREAARYNRAALREQKLKNASKLRSELKEYESTYAPARIFGIGQGLSANI